MLTKQPWALSVPGHEIHFIKLAGPFLGLVLMVPSRYVGGWMELTAIDDDNFSTNPSV